MACDYQTQQGGDLRYWAIMRKVAWFFDHMIIYSLMTNEKRYISNFKYPMETKSDRVVGNHIPMGQEMFSSCLTDRFFANLEIFLQKRWLDILKRHLRSVSKTLPRQFTNLFQRYLKDSSFANLVNVWRNYCLNNLCAYLEIA